MLIIDAQVHIWGSGKPSGHHRQTSLYTAQELILEMGQAGRGRRGAASAKLGPAVQRNGDRGRQADIPINSARWAGSRWTIRPSASGSRPGSSSPAWLACAGR